MATAPASTVAATRDGQTALALRLTKHLAPPSGAAESENVAFSPLSVYASLALVAAGAGGATLAQLLAFLGAPSADGLADFGRCISELFLADNSGPRVLFGGGVWMDASRGALTEAFRDVAAKSYKSEARIVSFGEPKETAAMINDWVKEATDNLIDTVISSDDIIAVTDLILTNAVYFKGDWYDRFNSISTKPGTFHRLDSSCIEAQFMDKFTAMEALWMDGFKVLKLPYKPGHTKARAEQTPSPKRHGGHGGGAYNTQYSMFVFLPDKHGGLPTMVDVITSAPGYLYSVLSKMETKLVDLKLPRFEIKFNWDLQTDLCKLGLSLPFSPEVADLRGMCEEDGDGRPTFLSKVSHAAVIKVNEAGTEAAASTFKLRGGGGIEFVADHPFTFFIMEENTRVIVFAGHVLDPTK